MSMYRVHIEDFEGPLDLLLFFIRRDELDIFNIPIARIADEYLSYVRVLEKIDLDAVGEFLYMAAMLINIKARMLLPTPELDEEGEPIDPRRELVERLLEYVRFKEASQRLTELKTERDDVFTRGLAGEDAEAVDPAESAKVDASIFDLIGSLRRILTHVPDAPVHALEREDYSIEEQQMFIIARLQELGRVGFGPLVSHRSRAFIITTFLAVLELARQGVVAVLVPDDPTDFYLESAANKLNGAGLKGGDVNGDAR